MSSQALCWRSFYKAAPPGSGAARLPLQGPGQGLQGSVWGLTSQGAAGAGQGGSRR